LYRRHWPKAPASRAATCGLILSSLMVCSVMKS